MQTIKIIVLTLVTVTSVHTMQRDSIPLVAAAAPATTADEHPAWAPRFIELVKMFYKEKPIKPEQMAEAGELLQMVSSKPANTMLTILHNPANFNEQDRVFFRKEFGLPDTISDHDFDPIKQLFIMQINAALLPEGPAHMQAMKDAITAAKKISRKNPLYRFVQLYKANAKKALANQYSDCAVCCI